MNDTAVRSMTISNYDAVLTLWQSCEGVGLSSADSRENIAAYLQRNPGQSFIALAGETLVGAVLSGHDGRRGFIHHLAVHPDYRRQGIGKNLIKHCLKALREDGIQKCHLFVFNKNQNAIQFWRDTGWTERVELSMFSQHTG